MPCRCDDFESKSYDETDKLKTCLCTALNFLENMSYNLESIFNREDSHMYDWLNAWWTNHKLEDQRFKQMEIEKQKREILRKNALAKLTPEEISALKYDVIPF